MNQATINISQALGDIGKVLDEALEEVAGERIAFTLLVFTAGRASYISSASHEDNIMQMKHLIELWEAGMPDVPAHTVAG